MKVLVVTNVFPNKQQPNFGIFIKQRINYVRKYCDLKVAASVPYFPLLKLNKKGRLFSQIPAKEYQDGIEVFHPLWVVIPKIGMNIAGLSYFFSIVGAIKKIKQEFDFDLIDAHCIYPDGVGAILLSKFFKKPAILSARGTDINLYPQYPFVRKQIIYAMKNANKIIAVSEALKDKIVEMGIDASKVIVIPNGVDTTKFRLLSKIESRKELNLPQDKKIVLSIGNLIEGKGFQYLISAIDKIKDIFQDILLIIIGDGDYRHKLEKQIKRANLESYVELVQSKPHEELLKWYNAADLFCLATLREGCPNVLLESLACGLPVISGKVGGAPEIITSSDIGILIENSTDDEELSKAILIALNKNWETNKLINSVKDRSWEKVGENIYTVFKSIDIGGIAK